jgi:hypothetical protein
MDLERDFIGSLPVSFFGKHQRCITISRWTHHYNRESLNESGLSYKAKAVAARSPDKRVTQFLVHRDGVLWYPCMKEKETRK